MLVQVGAPAQRDAIALAKHASANGAAGVMLITPYYNRVGASELALFARAVHGAAGGLPLIAYTMPAMAGAQWPLDVLRELAAEGVVSGVKESADEVGRMLGIIDACPPPFAAFCGTPPLLDPDRRWPAATGASSRSRTPSPSAASPSTRRRPPATGCARPSCSLRSSR